MYDSNLRGEVHKSVQVLETKLSELEYSGMPFPTANYDLVLDIIETEDKTIIRQYYFVDHDTRTLFWLDYYDMRTLLYVPGVTEPGHISEYFIFPTHPANFIYYCNNQEHRLESLYWWGLYFMPVLAWTS